MFLIHKARDFHILNGVWSYNIFLSCVTLEIKMSKNRLIIPVYIKTSNVVLILDLSAFLFSLFAKSEIRNEYFQDRIHVYFGVLFSLMI